MSPIFPVLGCHAYLEIDGRGVDPDRLASAWRRLLAHHPMLRAKFLDAGYQQVLAVPAAVQLTVHDMRNDPEHEIKRGLKRIRNRLSHRVLAVEKGEVAGLEISLMPDGRTRLHFDIDLLVADVHSLHIILRDLAAAYARDCPPPAPRNWNFANYLKQTASRRAADRETAGQYWKKRLKSLPGAPELPLKTKPESITKPVFKRRTYLVDTGDWARLQQRSAAHQVTPAMVLLTAYAEILDRWSAGSRFLINIPLFDRQTGVPGLEDVVADFTNLLLLAVDCGTPQPFLERARGVQAQFLRDVANAAYSGVQVQRDMARERDGERLAAPVVFASNLGTPLMDEQCRETLGRLSYMISQTPQVWLDFQLYETEDGLLLAWDAVDALFPDGLIDRMFAAYARLIESLATGDVAWQSAPDVLSADQRQRREKETAVSAGHGAQCRPGFPVPGHGQGVVPWTTHLPRGVEPVRRNP